MGSPERRAVEQVARESYGRLVAFLAARSRDVAAAEDALSDAFAAALETWPRDGVPTNPAAWLLAAARRRLIDAARHRKVRDAAADRLRELVAAAETAAPADAIPDDRLKLLFAVAHPAIDPAAHTPLMLSAVLGLTAAEFASAFLVPQAAMGQRLVRAKAKIRDAGIAFAVPDPADLPARLDPVLAAVYAAFGSGWDDVTGADARRRGFATEAVWLGRVIVDLVPGDPEALGLLALMLHCEARRAARRDAAGGYVPLADQDVRLWSLPLIREAETALAAAAAANRPGRYQLEAAIQSAHAIRAVTGRPDWAAVAVLYDALVATAPATGALVGRAAAVAEARGPAAGLAALTDIPADRVATYQPYWALAAHLHARVGNGPAAANAFDRAIGLSEDPAVRDFLIRKRAGRPRA